MNFILIAPYPDAAVSSCSGGSAFNNNNNKNGSSASPKKRQKTTKQTVPPQTWVCHCKGLLFRETPWHMLKCIYCGMSRPTPRHLFSLKEEEDDNIDLNDDDNNTDDNTPQKIKPKPKAKLMTTKERHVFWMDGHKRWMEIERERDEQQLKNGNRRRRRRRNNNDNANNRKLRIPQGVYDHLASQTINDDQGNPILDEQGNPIKKHNIAATSIPKVWGRLNKAVRAFRFKGNNQFIFLENLPSKLFADGRVRSGVKRPNRSHIKAALRAMPDYKKGTYAQMEEWLFRDRNIWVSARTLCKYVKRGIIPPPTGTRCHPIKDLRVPRRSDQTYRKQETLATDDDDIGPSDGVLFTLGKDLWGVIFDFLGYGRYLQLAPVSKQFRSLYIRTWDGIEKANRPRQLRTYWGLHTKYEVGVESLELAKYFYICDECSKWVQDFRTRCQHFRYTVMQEAAAAGNLDIIDWAHSFEHRWDGESGKLHECLNLLASRYANLETVKHLHSLGCPFHEDSVAAAARAGNREIMEYNLNHVGWGDTCVWAANGGRLELLQWARTKGCRWDGREAEMIAAAASSGSIPLLKYLLDKGCRLCNEAPSAAAQKCRVEMLEFLLTKQCPVKGDLPYEAALRATENGGDLRVLQVLYRQGYIAHSCGIEERKDGGGQEQLLDDGGNDGGNDEDNDEESEPESEQEDNDEDNIKDGVHHFNVLKFLIERGCPWSGDLKETLRKPVYKAHYNYLEQMEKKAVRQPDGQFKVKYKIGSGCKVVYG